MFVGDDAGAFARSPRRQRRFRSRRPQGRSPRPARRTTLPIAEVPNLQPGDRLWVHPDLPDSQSVHYLMVVVFLRGATNPPPDSWFTRVETWSKPVHDEGIFVIVPRKAPKRHSSFSLPRPAEPSALCAPQSAASPAHSCAPRRICKQASLDRQRLEKYLEAVRETYTADPEQLKRTPPCWPAA